MNPINDPRSATKQIGRVYSAIKDGGWHKLSDIAATTGDPKKSVSSRIRDLRLPAHGGYKIESRVANKTTQSWEYRLISGKLHKAKAQPCLGMIGVTGIMGVRGYPAGQVAQAGNPNKKQVKFLNAKTLKIERIDEDKCRIEPLGAFKRVVALDDQGIIIPHLVTTQDSV